MKKVWEVIKKVLIWIGTVFVAIFTVLFIKERDCDAGGACLPSLLRKRRGFTPDNDTTTEDINAKAAKKREEAVERISRADARSICEGYGTVCDTIADGKSRFRKRCGRADN